MAVVIEESPDNSAGSDYWNSASDAFQSDSLDGGKSADEIGAAAA